MFDEGTHWVALGRIKGAFGVHGEVRVMPYQLPIARVLPDPTPMPGFPVSTLLESPVWRLGREVPAPREIKWHAGHLQGEYIHARLQGFETREEVQTLAGQQVWVSAQIVPKLSVNQYYWFQLTGLTLLDVTQAPEEPRVQARVLARELGIVESLFATGSNDVLVVREHSGEERLIPFIHDTIVQVDLAAGAITARLMPGL
ncbi:MAG: ribosome maturation factor RimM [Magnetococcus sp. YQC-5]